MIKPPGFLVIHLSDNSLNLEMLGSVKSRVHTSLCEFLNEFVEPA